MLKNVIKYTVLIIFRNFKLRDSSFMRHVFATFLVKKTFHSIFKTVACRAFLVKLYLGSKIAEHDVTMTLFPVDLLCLQNFSSARMRRIDARRDEKFGVVTLL